MNESSNYTPAPEDLESTDHSWSFADTGKKRLLSRDLSPHSTDEVFNSVSHLSAAMLSLLGSILLITGASAQGAVWKIVAFSIYGACLSNLFICSTLHHAINSTEKVEARLRMLDYLAIYPLIAGTFTPLCLVYLHDTVIGWSFFGVAWFLAFVGMYLTATLGPGLMPKWMSMTFYITIGWIGAFLMFWLIPYIKLGGLTLFFLGGLSYTVGGYIYTTERPNPYPGVFGFHEIWHVFVIFGAGFHFSVMFFYVLPWEG
jgi:hemolysin III